MATTVHLVDASPYIFRAYFSLPESMAAPDGRPVNAVSGFRDFLLRLLADESPTHIGVAFDRSLNTSFRNELYAAYKAQRELPPAELEAQLGWCERLAHALGMVTWSDERFEADDLIATAAAKLARKGHRVVVVSPDKDLCQLVSERVELFDFAKATRYGPAEVLEKFGVPPERMRDYQGLAGDAVDNIPGVKGVGAKTAAALMTEFASLEELYRDLAAVASMGLRGAKSVALKLEAERDLAFLSRELATLSVNAPARTRLDELRWRGAVAARIQPLFEELGMQRALARIPRWNGRPGA